MFEYLGGYSSLDPNKSYSNPFTGYRTSAGSFGITTDPRTANQIKEVSSKLSSGAKQIEVALVSPEIFDSIPKHHLKEINELSKITGVDVSVHAPVMDVAGFDRSGFSELNREMAERRILDIIERSKEINPNGNVPIVFHSAEGIPGSEWKTLGDSEGKEKRIAKRLIAVEKESGKMIPLEEEKMYYPGGEKGAYEVFKSSQDRLKMINETTWEDNLNKILFQKEMGDKILSEVYPAGKELYFAVKQDKTVFNNLPEPQQKVVLNIQIADEHLIDAQRALSNIFSKVYENSDEEVRKKLEIAGKKFTKNILGVDTAFLDNLPDDKKRLAILNQEDLERRSKALQLFAQDLKEITPQSFVSLEDFAIEKTSKTFGNAAFKAYKKFKDNAPLIYIENPPVGMGLSTGEDLKQLVIKAREEFINNAIKEGINKKEAEKKAEKLIGAVWDVGHINMLRKQGFKEEDIIEETKKIAPFVKHVHLSDNFGYEHTELPMGMGNVPLKEIMERLGEKGFEGKKIIEASQWWQHFQTNPLKETLEGFGSPMFTVGGMPYFNQSIGFYQNYSSGFGRMLPGINYQTFGAGFSQLPSELGGEISGGQGSKFSGRGME